ncbi:zeta toxin family protein [Nocardia sp. BSTN01]|nr:zeta toxin family protein [Nocardia sp. BSTN01]
MEDLGLSAAEALQAGARRLRIALVEGCETLSSTGRNYASAIRRARRDFMLSDAEMRRIFERRIVADELEGRARSLPSGERPELVVVLAQPAAGKSTAVRDIEDSFQSRGGAVPLIADDYMKYHPQFNELHDLDDFTAGDHIYPVA